MSAAARRESGAVEQLIEMFLPHISKTARVYRHNPAVERAELMQDGIVGLLRALERFDPGRGTPFWPYASWWVRQAMQQLAAEMTRQVVLSDRALRRLSRVRDARTLWLRTHGREPTVHELMEACGCGRDEVEHLLAAELPSRALDEPFTNGDGGSEALVERLADETSADDYERVVDRVQMDRLRERCEQLPDRERHVLYAHYGFTGPARTLREIAVELSLSAERVRQIADSGLTRLRESLEPPALTHV